MVTPTRACTQQGAWVRTVALALVCLTARTAGLRAAALSTVSGPCLLRTTTTPRASSTTTTSSRASSTTSTSTTLAAADALFTRGDERPVVLYDGVCNLCNSAVSLVLDNDPDGRVRFAALQSDVGRALLERSDRARDDISSIVLVTKTRAYIKSEAVLKIADILKRDLPVARLAVAGKTLVPTPVADVLYDLVADNRYKVLGHSDTCRLSNDGFEDRFLSDFSS